jgi:hypothetical protein
MDPYMFQGEAGEVVRIRMSEGGSLEPRIELFNDQGRLVASLDSFGDTILDLTLESAGVYYLLLSDDQGEETGVYSVTLQRLNPPTGSVALVYGQTLEATLEAISEMDPYMFQGEAGEVVRIRMSEGGSLEPRIELFNDQGRLIGTQETFGDTIFDVTLETTGTYYLLLSDGNGDESGVYSVTLQRLNPPIGSVELVYGQTLNATLEAISAMDPYRFQGEAGEVVRIRMSEGSSLEPRIELFNDQGRPLASLETFGDTILDVTLETTGTYYLLLSDGNGDESGVYSVTLQRLNPPIGSVELVYGQTLNATLEAISAMDPYRFQGSAGDVVRIRMTDPSSLEPRIELFNDQGHLLGTQETFEDTTLDATLESTGTYYFLLSDGGGDETGDYTVNLQKLN